MKRIRQLDGLRFVAVSFVLLQHFAYYIGQKFSAGYYGVDLFFVISGYLITGILLKQTGTPGKTYLQFLGRRTLRIFPIYYLTLGILWLVNFPHVRESILYFLTYTYNYAVVIHDIPLNHTTHFWSLSVEEQFYIFWPWLVLGLKKYPSLLKVILWGLILFCGLQLVWHVVPSLTPYNYYGLIPRAFSLALGGLGAIYYSEGKISFRWLAQGWIEPVSILILLFFLHYPLGVQPIILPLISLFFILKAVHKGFQTPWIATALSNRWVVYLGTISYGIYIYHLPIAYYFTNDLFYAYIWNRIDFDAFGPLAKLQYHPWILKLPLYSLAAVVAAHVSYQYIEKPILQLRDRYFRYPSSQTIE
ncbi:MAG TPA: acyltransferase [Ferruginibacter sp.]|nr:acyltransferase [Ferruginibacter sp.]HRO17178.1 acyltransferase [Ferruginibacter sp.]HRQ20356.1 acyltransferase [Ferruginibacter sp.]